MNRALIKTETKVIEILTEHLFAHSEHKIRIVPTTTLGDMDTDSLDHVEIAMLIEEEFEMEFSSTVIDTVFNGSATVASIAAAIDAHRSEKGAA
ncbi:hypothetical protein AN189_07440 [Loktanella sp. 3ANDIMAR09]|uniref:phosphopantetheine-binding protein n=1 Tax=Loktanella sp. 3ANDIMAR09 TaxID=1225657 RepID=UPI0006FF2402|nr:phosphopantetheine-binding protein [Loktanella sp. 3ANDIMAR09]KQI68723.1 hypothetical protein AN189_07440 [Loktanella sp. 3ANDIMAR09]